MLTIGQMVYDTTNKRPIIYGGVEMYQNSKTGKCTSYTIFLTEDMKELLYGGDFGPCPFKYINFEKDSVEGIAGIPTGKFCGKYGGGCFGLLDFEKILKMEEVADLIKATFEEAKTWPPPTPEEDKVQEKAV